LKKNCHILLQDFEALRMDNHGLFQIYLFGSLFAVFGSIIALNGGAYGLSPIFFTAVLGHVIIIISQIFA
jgi:hypothetical protein